MAEKVLVTGGAGFIGSHLVDALLAAGHEVRVLDNLEPQVHGGLRERGQWPGYLAAECERILGDVRDRDTLRKAIQGAEVIFHQAAAVGVGQSMYAIEHYVDANTRGTAVLLDVLANEKHNVRKLLVASSMSIYGEGRYRCPEHGETSPRLRPVEQLARRDWEMRCPTCGARADPLPTDEDKPLYPTSVYAITKRSQEEMCLAVGLAYGLPTVALRYFNAYGTRQALSNPYTGVAAIFSGRLLNGKQPVIFEDGLQSRDLTHVKDIVQANLLALERDEMDYGAFNVGTGRQLTILDVAEALNDHLGNEGEPEIVHRFRAGDIRHCYADIRRIQAMGFQPTVRFEDGVAELVNWVRSQTATDDFEQARSELQNHGLTV
ncbi:MAG: NAD-dependent epimerase/dehydratase family protein [Anaerolineae bacterium]|nr:NAD-dependent epimerase/dehydratase family protein [Anaerolineae bacterium]